MDKETKLILIDMVMAMNELSAALSDEAAIKFGKNTLMMIVEKLAQVIPEEK